MFVIILDIICAVLLLVMGIYLLFFNISFSKNKIECIAEIISYSRAYKNAYSYNLSIIYNNNLIFVRSTNCVIIRKKSKIGKKIIVYYNPKYPNIAILKKKCNIITITFFMFLGSFIFFFSACQ